MFALFDFANRRRHLPFPLKKLKIERGQTRTLLRPAYSPGDAQHRDDHSMVVQGQGVSHLGQLFVPRTVSELHGVNFTNRIFAYFLYKMDGTYLPMTGLYSPGYSGRSKGAPFTSAVFLWRLFFAYRKCLCTIHNSTTRRVRSPPKRSQNESFRSKICIWVVRMMYLHI